jgi:hypothetical protein
MVTRRDQDKHGWMANSPRLVEYRIVKVFYAPQELIDLLGSHGLPAEVHRIADRFLAGSAPSAHGTPLKR